MRRTTIVSRGAIGLIACLIGCSGGDRNGTAADSLGRDLNMAPGDSTHALGDREATGGAARGTADAKPAADRNDASGRALATGTTITAATSTRISSASNKAGETVTARVSSDVKDASGRVVIPAGSRCDSHYRHP